MGCIKLEHIKHRPLVVFSKNLEGTRKKRATPLFFMLDYFPYGKVLREFVNGEKERYLTTQHERDNETGLDYRGARYYDSDVARFLSLDPKAMKLMNLSTYSYCAGNPIGYRDDNGEYPTPWEAALLSKAVYGDNMDDFDLNGWKVSNAINDIPNIVLEMDATGFKSQLFERKVDGVIEYVYVFAGTEDAKDAAADANQLVGKSLQYSRAVENSKELSKALGDYEITFVGHSLGGGLAKVSALATGGTAITLNPAWLSPATIINEGLKNKTAVITNYIVDGEILNASQELIRSSDIGKLFLSKNGVDIKISNWALSFFFYNSIQRHSIDQVITYMKYDSSYVK